MDKWYLSASHSGNEFHIEELRVVYVVKLMVEITLGQELLVIVVVVSKTIMSKRLNVQRRMCIDKCIITTVIRLILILSNFKGQYMDMIVFQGQVAQRKVNVLLGNILEKDGYGGGCLFNLNLSA
ncbi:hypothetical protein ACFE04_000938 [Oxalis oulophora]